MKRTLTALAVAAAAFTAQPAAADSNDVIGGLIFGIIVSDILNNSNSHAQPQPHYPPQNRRHHVCNRGYTQYMDHYPRYDIVTKVDNCTGAILEERTIWKRSRY
jgi:hypothetical protein